MFNVVVSTFEWLHNCLHVEEHCEEKGSKSEVHVLGVMAAVKPKMATLSSRCKPVQYENV